MTVVETLRVCECGRTAQIEVNPLRCPECRTRWEAQA